MNNAKKLIASLKKHKATLALAESCTGGYGSYLLTKIPGASKVFKAGLVVYSLEAKYTFLGIPLDLLKKTNGVSRKVSALLAQNVRKKLKTDFGASVVGYAGPTGKKKGLIYYAVAKKNKSVVKTAQFKGSRDQIRKKAATLLIELIVKQLTHQKP